MAQSPKDAVRAWLLMYAWLDEPDAKKHARIDCIMAQDDWKHIDALADKYAGAQFEPGPQAYTEGQQFALSALYECHEGPHTDACPAWR